MFPSFLSCCCSYSFQLTTEERNTLSLRTKYNSNCFFVFDLEPNQLLTYISYFVVLKHKLFKDLVSNNGEIHSQIPLSHCIVVTLYCVHTYTAHIPYLPMTTTCLPACLPGSTVQRSPARRCQFSTPEAGQSPRDSILSIPRPSLSYRDQSGQVQ